MNTETSPSNLRPDFNLVGMLLDNRYRVNKVLGRGGMGAVYFGRDERLDRPVVVKVPHLTFLAEPGFKERFQLEVASLIRIDHPRVVKVFDAGEVQGIPYAVLQYLDGGDLKERLEAQGGKVSPESVMAWLPAMSEALDFLHGKETIHRDVKPANVLFDHDGNAYLADFGVAKALGAADTGLTQTGATPGSPAFMAPEVITGSKLTPAYDQYSLATVVYLALSGDYPYEGDSAIKVLFKKANEDPCPLHERNPALSPTVTAVVMRALDPEPTNRFPSCQEFAAAYADAVAQQPATSMDQTQREFTPPKGLRTRGTKTAGPKGTLPAGSHPAQRASSPWVPLGLLLAGVLLVAGFLLRDRLFSGTPPEDPSSSVAHTETQGDVKTPTPVVTPPPSKAPIEPLEEPVPPTKEPSSSEVEQPPELADPAEAETLNEEPPSETAEPPPALPPLRLLSLTPKPGATVGRTVTVRGQASSSLTSALVAGRAARLIGVDSFECEVTVEEAAPVLEVVVVAGGQTHSTNLPLIADLEAPVLSLMPEPGSKLETSEVTLQGTANEDIDLLVLDGKEQSATGSQFQLALPLVEGTNRFRLTVTDRFGNERTITYELTRHTPIVEEPVIEAPIVRKPIDKTPNTEPTEVTTPPPVEIPSPFLWAEVLELAPDPTVVTDARARQRIVASGLPWRVRDRQSGIELLLIPPGSCEIGSQNGAANEQPKHPIRQTIPFYLGRYEVTRAQWCRLLDPLQRWSGPDQRSAKLPANYVSWELAERFARAAGMRLPWEAEWEYASRAGASDRDWCFGSNPETLKEFGWFLGNRGGRKEPFAVGTRRANAWGLHDLHGNVWEYCSDWYAGNEYRYRRGVTEDPHSQTLLRTKRVARGGATTSQASQCRSAYRLGFKPTLGAASSGVRLVKSVRR